MCHYNLHKSFSSPHGCQGPAAGAQCVCEKLAKFVAAPTVEFDGEKYRTNSYNKVLDLIYQHTNELLGREKEKGEAVANFSNSAPRAGVEPARVAPLVFETSASTDSAIWLLTACF